MVRLSEYMNAANLPIGFGLVVFGELATHCLEETEKENKYLEGICPERIFLSDEWMAGNMKAWIKPAQAHTSYTYYPSEYLFGHQPWTPACTSFAIFSIAYKLLTGELPYIGDVPEELLNTNDGLEYIRKMRRVGKLKLSDIPPSFREFFAKGLALKKRERYQAIGDTAEEFGELCEHFKIPEAPEPNPIAEPNLDSPQSELEKLLAKANPDFVLDVQRAVEGSLDDLVGLSELKQYLRNGVLAILQNPEKAKKYKLHIPNGLLLYGPPGCGKTVIAKKFAAECRMNYAVINTPDIASTLVHGTQKIIGQLFKQAAIFAPIVLIFDEIEVMAPDRNLPDNVKVAEDTNAFLSELCTCAERGIFVIGTTNRPTCMDSAVLRSGRFDKKMYVPLPDEQTRAEIFRAYLKGRPIAKNIDYLKLAKMTSSGYISSDIEQICNEVAGKAFITDDIITQDLIEQVIRDGGPSVSRNELRSYEESRRYMEPAAKCTPYINQIGFR